MAKIVRDISQAKQLEKQFRQAQKMEAIGRLAGGIAHDFNNLLTVIRGYSQVIQEGLISSQPFQEEVKEIIETTERVSSLTRQLLMFSRQEFIEQNTLNLNIIISNIERMLERIIGENIDLETVMESLLGDVKADAGQIEQMILNLVVNARDAMPQGGKLTIETRNVDLDERYILAHHDAIQRPYILLAVSDTGCGIDEENQRQIFEPFFTTKNQRRDRTRTGDCLRNCKASKRLD